MKREQKAGKNIPGPPGKRLLEGMKLFRSVSWTDQRSWKEDNQN